MKISSELSHRMSLLGIRQEDIIEKFIRSSGPGGQNANKVSTCVYLKHIPTGIEVKYQEERNQLLNRIAAWQLLIDKIESRRLKIKAQEKSAQEKLKRKSRKRPRGLQLRILEYKRKHSEKKKLRAKIYKDSDI